MNFDRVLAQVAKPSRYCGNEFNVVKKEWEGAALVLRHTVVACSPGGRARAP